MHKFKFFQAGRVLASAAALCALLVLAGCDVTITNLTPTTVPQNPSHIYTITASFQPKTSNVIPESIQPRIIIDGQSFNMTKAAAANAWEFEYHLPPGRTTASYYFICDFSVKSGGNPVPHESYSELQNLRIDERYVLRAEANRAPVGARVNVVGAGFTPQDVIYFNHQPARTVFESPASLSFFVPAVPANASYQLQVSGPGGVLPVGTFRVDAADIQVSPSPLTLREGETQMLTFSVATPAPAGGLLIEVTTDIPQSIIMPEVIVPAGATSVDVSVQGGKPGSGSLFYKTGAGEASIGLTVMAR